MQSCWYTNVWEWILKIWEKHSHLYSFLAGRLLRVDLSFGATLTHPQWTKWPAPEEWIFRLSCWEKKRNHLIPPGFTDASVPCQVCCGGYSKQRNDDENKKKVRFLSFESFKYQLNPIEKCPIRFLFLNCFLWVFVGIFGSCGGLSTPIPRRFAGPRQRWLVEVKTGGKICSVPRHVFWLVSTCEHVVRKTKSPEWFIVSVSSSMSTGFWGYLKSTKTLVRSG